MPELQLVLVVEGNFRGGGRRAGEESGHGSLFMRLRETLGISSVSSGTCE